MFQTQDFQQASVLVYLNRRHPALPLPFSDLLSNQKAVMDIHKSMWILAITSLWAFKSER